MPIHGPRRPGGGGGAGGVHASIQKADDASMGVEIRSVEDASWALTTEERDYLPVQASAEYFREANPADRLRVTLPADLPDAFGVDGDAWRMPVLKGNPGIPAVPGVAQQPAVRASFLYDLSGIDTNGIRVTFDGALASTQGVDGNDWTFAVAANANTGVVSAQVNVATQSVTLFVGTIGTTYGHAFNALDTVNTGGVSFSVEYVGNTVASSSLAAAGSDSPDFFSGGSDLVPAQAAVPAVAREALSAVVSPLPIRRLTLRIIATDTLNQIAAVVQAATYDDVDGVERTIGAANVEVAGAGGTNFGANQIFSSSAAGDIVGFEGGVAPEPISAALDVATKVLTVRYYDVEDTFEDILNVVNTITGFTPVLIHETPEADSPEAAGFTRPFRGAGGSDGGGGDSVAVIPSTFAQIGDTLENQVDDRYFQVANFPPGGSIRDIDSLYFLVEDYAVYGPIPGKFWNDLDPNDGTPAATQFGRGQLVLLGSRPDVTGTSDTGGVLAQLHIRKYAGDTFWVASERGATFANFKVFRDQKGSVVVTPAVPSADPVDVDEIDNLINPKDAYGAADYKKFYFANALLWRVDRVHHEGHSAEAPFIVLNSSDFRGFHANSDQVAAPSDGDFFANYFFGDFEIYRTSNIGGHQGLTGWYNFDPTEAGEVWDEVNNAGETLLLSWAPGSLIHNIADLPRLASAAGQVFMDRTNNRIIAVASYTPASAEYNRYYGAIYIPPGRVTVAAGARPPVAYFYGVGQDEREPDDYPIDPQDIGAAGTLRLQFAANGPHEEFFGGAAAIGNPFVPVADIISTIDVILNRPLLTEMVLQLPAGTYDFDFIGGIRVTSDSAATMRLHKVTSGLDDRVMSRGTAFQTQDVGHYTDVILKARDIVLDGAEQVYFRGTGFSNELWRFFLRIAKTS